MTEQSKLYPLPEGWVWSTLGEISTHPQYGYTTSASYEARGPKFLRITDLSSGSVNWDDVPYCAEPPDDLDKYRVFEGDILIARSGSVGKAYLVENPPEAVFASYLIRFRPIIVDGRYVEAFLQTQFYFDQIADSSSGNTIFNVNAQKMLKLNIPIAPVNEQHRIVDEIEAQFSRLDAWLAIMEKLREQLPRLRASILKAAVEGRLVEHDSYDESAEVLLRRVLDQRRTKWEREYLAELEAKGKPAPRDNKWKTKYPEPLPPDFGDYKEVPELPDGWIWTSLAEIAAHEDNSITDGPFGSKLKTSHYTEFGARVIRLQNIGAGDFVGEDEAFISLEHYNTLLKHQVFTNDLVIAALGDSLPRACIIPEGLGPAIVKADCMRFKPHSELADTGYMNAVLNSETVKTITSNRIHGVGRPRLNQAEIKSLPVPLAPYSLQLRINEDIAERLSIVSRLSEIIEVNMKRAEQMRQSILKKAFDGRLVEQDHNEESASELLERIRQERLRRTEEEIQMPKQQRERRMSTETERKPLIETLMTAGRSLSARELFQQAGFTHETIDEFYEELRKAIYVQNTIQPKANETTQEVFLEALN